MRRKEGREWEFFEGIEREEGEVRNGTEEGQGQGEGVSRGGGKWLRMEMRLRIRAEREEGNR